MRGSSLAASEREVKSYAIAEWEDDERALVARVRRLAAAGIDFIQLRAKTLPGKSLYDLSARCAGVVEAPTRLIVNSRADIALAIGAGVHLPSNGMPVVAARSVGVAFVGRSCHSVDEVRQAASDGADYALLGPLFATRSKVSEPRISPRELAAATSAGLAVFALGGISMDNLEELRGLPLEGIAAVTLFMHDEPLEAIVEVVRTL